METVTLDIEKDFKLIFEALEGLIILDKDAKILFITDDVAKEEGYEHGKDLIGQSVRKLLPTNTAYKVLQTGEKHYGEIYLVEGESLISNAFPIYKNGEIAGAIEYDVFRNTSTLHDFLNHVTSLSDELKYYKHELKKLKGAKYSIDNIVGKSDCIQNMKTQISHAARSNSTVLILGETGTGKELVANSIHMLSTRSLKNFISINCAAIPSELFEAEFFGYETGSFTGAKQGGKKGLLELANGGTLFLDEINQMPITMQAKLLRAIQEREFLKVGGEETVSVDIRIIAASNEDLIDLIKEKRFREDLFYRLNVFEIKVPPLRERKEDIPLLVENILESLNVSLGRVGPKHRVKGILPQALKLLTTHEWPGNVRELINVIERAMNRCELDEYIDVEHLTGSVGIYHSDQKIHLDSDINTLGEAKKILEIQMIRSTLSETNGNITKAADILGISRQMLNRKIKQYEIQ